jgi:hypothetical protein
MVQGLVRMRMRNRVLVLAMTACSQLVEHRACATPLRWGHGDRAGAVLVMMMVMLALVLILVLLLALVQV